MNFVIVGNLSTCYPGSALYCISIVLQPSFSSSILYWFGINVMLRLLLNDSVIAKQTQKITKKNMIRKHFLGKYSFSLNLFTIFIFWLIVILTVTTTDSSDFNERIRKRLLQLVVGCVHCAKYR